MHSNVALQMKAWTFRINEKWNRLSTVICERVFVPHSDDNVAYDELSFVSGLAAFFGQKTGQA